MTKGSARNVRVDEDSYFFDGQLRAECPFRNLWAAVLRQAVQDCGNANYRSDVVRWTGTYGFKKTCETLDLDPGRVATVLKARVAKSIGAPPKPRQVNPRRDGSPRAIDRKQEIEALLAQGMTCRQIAAAIGFSAAMVSKVVRQGPR